MLNEPLSDGPATGLVFRLQPMMDQYYKPKEWDAQTGIPSEQKLAALARDHVAEELEDYR